MATLKTLADIKKLGTILGIWAHPDDETFTMGGIMAAAILNGQKVACITATRGEKGVQDETRWPAKDLGKIRTRELLEAMKILGVKDQHFLDCPDGDCESIRKNAVIKQLASYIKTYKPDSIFTFGRDGLTGHPDHCCVSKWTVAAVKLAGSKAKIYIPILTEYQYASIRAVDEKFNFFFNIPKPPVCEPEDCAICYKLSDEIYNMKRKALEAMPSQYEAVLASYGTAIHSSLGTESFVEAV